MKTIFSTKYKAQSTKALLFTAFCCLPSLGIAQETVIDTAKVKALDEVTVSAVRAKGKNPVTFTNLSKKEIAPRNLGQDIPILLNYLPSVVTTTDAGNGVGYTYMRVRGADGSRINVTLNGIPFNDRDRKSVV
jgi:iron complex outermembrane receptor protein